MSCSCFYSYAWCTNSAMETGKNWSRRSACLPCSVLIGLWSPELPKSCLEGVTLIRLVEKENQECDERDRQARKDKKVFSDPLPALPKMAFALVSNIWLLWIILNSPEKDTQSHFIQTSHRHAVSSNHRPFSVTCRTWHHQSVLCQAVQDLSLLPSRALPREGAETAVQPR